jgi:hypothetical protein
MVDRSCRHTGIELRLPSQAILVTVGLILSLSVRADSYAASPIKLHSSVPKAIVCEMARSVEVTPEVAREGFLVDGSLAFLFSSTSYLRNSTVVPNLEHTISADAYSASNKNPILAPMRAGPVVSFVSRVNWEKLNGPKTGVMSSSTTPTLNDDPTAKAARIRRSSLALTVKSTSAFTPASTSIGTPNPTPTSAMLTSTTFYISPIGSDSAAGSSSSPWRTIQKAASTLQAGQTAVVLAGNYRERVDISSSGSQAAPITLQVAGGADAQLLGFDLKGSNWVLNGFDISTQTNGSEGWGIYVTASASYDTIENNYIHELCHEGIFMDPTVSHISVLTNHIWQAEMAGAQVDGTNDLIQGNEVWGTQQYPAHAGGIYTRCATSEGADADAFRFFGQHNVFQYNYAHDIYTELPTNPNPHTDCFQTWGSAAMEVDDILIEQNLCRWPVASTAVDAETAMIEGVEGRVGTVTFQNNELSNMRQGIVVGSNVDAIRINNNTWDHIVEEAIIFNGTRSLADEIINNIFYDVGAGGDSYAEVPSGSPVFEDNDFYMPGGAIVGTYPTVEPYISVDPMFVSYGDASGTGADFQLQERSPLKGAGTTLTEVTNDFYGVSRLGAAYSIGSAR